MGNPCAGAVYIVIADPGIGSHSAGSVHIVTLAVDPVPSLSVHSAGRIKIIPGISQQKPSSLHPTCSVKVIPGSIDQFPSRTGVRTVSVAVPPAVSAAHPGSSAGITGNPCAGAVYIVVADPGIGSHSARGIHIIAFTIDPVPAFSIHAAAARCVIVPGSSQVHPSGKHFAGAVKVIPGTVNFLRTGKHDTVFIQIVPGIAQTEPAGNHVASTVKIVPCAVNQFPLAGRIAAVGTLIPPAVAVLFPLFIFIMRNPDAIWSVIFSFCPGRSYHGAVGSKIIGFSFNSLTSGYHGAGSVQIIPGIIQMQPSGLHNARGVGIIPDPIMSDPSGKFGSIRTKIVIIAVGIFVPDILGGIGGIIKIAGVSVQRKYTAVGGRKSVFIVNVFYR